ncbi:MAG TPA: SET domain-containing protein-lysine N-methyltransferase, partial [Candidatus Pacearchaeota archaeon]|nr:SET domain-containing protein-lysine N-methyltransferase [Candidatus Pacearchaeota archaeon]
MDVVVKDSNIEGKGVFANKDFKKGEVVLRWNISHRLTIDDVNKISDKEKRYVNFHKGVYLFMQIPERYVNHSCEANTYIKDFCDIAKKDIKEEEEILSNYEEDNIPG